MACDGKKKSLAGPALMAMAMFRPVMVVTVAGTGAPGLVNGSSATAQFNSPDGVTIHPNGTIYIGDTGNNAIRMIDTAGTVSTMAGNVVPGFVDDQGSSARFNNPDGVAVDSAGNVYVADTGNNAIRKIDPAGNVTTVAGQGPGSPGSTDGALGAATFTNPTGITIDSTGTKLYVADEGSNKIREIDLVMSQVGTLAGSGAPGDTDGTGNGAVLDGPHAITFNASTGGLVFTDRNNDKVKTVTDTGAVDTLAGSGTSGFANGTGTVAEFDKPHGIGLDSAGNAYTGDELNNMVRFITPSGVVQTYAGNQTAGSSDGTASSATFNQPRGIALDTSGNIYVCDYANNKIRKIIVH
ncbi:MAG: SMP-30/gluconolactonase/LRE family protein [Spirochaetes bacterium]|jgi:sugar lactone lactonase YvrE|nr:SMP-30/gluconolactonase/LRE family protein [Spirochaetota bacterium]